MAKTREYAQGWNSSPNPTPESHPCHLPSRTSSPLPLAKLTGEDALPSWIQGANGYNSRLKRNFFPVHGDGLTKGWAEEMIHELVKE